jgi:hypothetical protein
MMTFVLPTESATRTQRAFPRAHLLEMTAVLKTSISRVPTGSALNCSVVSGSLTSRRPGRLLLHCRNAA